MFSVNSNKLFFKSHRNKSFGNINFKLNLFSFFSFLKRLNSANSSSIVFFPEHSGRQQQQLEHSAAFCHWNSQGIFIFYSSSFLSKYFLILQIYPLTTVMHQRLIFQYLQPTGEYQDVSFSLFRLFTLFFFQLLPIALESSVLDLILDYIDLRKVNDVRLTFDALKVAVYSSSYFSKPYLFYSLNITLAFNLVYFFFTTTPFST